MGTKSVPTLPLQSADLFHTDPVSAGHEHAVEVVLPFVQAALDAFMISPVMASRCDIEKTLGKINEATVLIASPELLHYLSYDQR